MSEYSVKFERDLEEGKKNITEKMEHRTSKPSNLPTNTKSSDEFLDPRTGEVIKIEESANDNDPKNGQSGKVRSHRNYLELQSQLEFVRQLRPGDEEVERYFGKTSSSDTNSRPLIEKGKKRETFKKKRKERAGDGATHHASIGFLPPKVTKRTNEFISERIENPRAKKNVLLTSLIEKSSINTFE